MLVTAYSSPTVQPVQFINCLAAGVRHPPQFAERSTEGAIATRSDSGSDVLAVDSRVF